MKDDKNLGLKIGAIFSIVSFLFTFTIAIPMFSVFPSAFLEQAISSVFPSLTNVDTGIITILVLAVLFLSALVFILKRVEKSVNENRKLKTSEIIVVMLIFYIIIHNLGYYTLLGISGFPIDALNTLLAIASFPFSSVLFVLIGFMMDWYWKKTAKTNVD